MFHLRWFLGEYKYYRDDCGSIVEFHTEQTLRHFPVAPDLEDFARRGVRLVLSGREILTLCPEDALVALCIHGTKDFLGPPAVGRRMFRKPPKRRVSIGIGFSCRAQALRAQRMLWLGMILAEVILDARVPRELAAQANSDAAASSMALQMTRRLLLNNAEPLSAAARFAFRRRSVPRHDGRLALCHAPRYGARPGRYTSGSAVASLAPALRLAASLSSAGQVPGRPIAAERAVCG